MKKKFQVVIIGGGLGGLTTALHLSKSNIECLIIEKSAYPSHKVCGEYVSNEVLPYLQYLGVDPILANAKNISKYLISTKKGKTVHGKLDLGGFGISRYCLDNLMFKQLQEAGGILYQDQVVAVQFNNDEFQIKTANRTEFVAQFVVGAFGKRSNLDKYLDRDFIQKKSHWLAIKAHYQANFDDSLVALHNFDGGYCGLSKVENDMVNVCYLVTYNSFKKEKDVEAFQKNVMTTNPHLKKFFQDAIPDFDQPLSISQVSFEKKEPIEKHLLMVGDTAGLIHPLCGNGMAMAIHAAKICSEALIQFFSGDLPSRNEVEKVYKNDWKLNFSKRLKTGRLLSKVFLNNRLSNIMMNSSQVFPELVPQIINKTHGDILTLESP
ncbi:NAD(P)/FAD-dependent oxidoreductase [Spongiivirga citrea]|uniref:NAD(P)-binding protein n=1 Tax=Spongiivirga citrea TaxID=1481457 RepID=A0A6M0CCV4_9FLAO|nr:FAD-dependent monooxygenase [Spongiivirga citrea]NER15626.1 NAD(P)-binding protein [Spongiivirga citrea]